MPQTSAFLRGCVSLVSLPSSPRPKSDACQEYHGMFFQRLHSLHSLRSFTSSHLWQKADFVQVVQWYLLFQQAKFGFKFFIRISKWPIAYHTCIIPLSYLYHICYRVTRGLRPAKCIGDSFPDGIRLPLFGQDCLEHLEH